MRLNKLILFISAASLMLTGKVSALGLGEITLKSALNEPLNAEIRLLQIRDLTEEEILVGLASNADFDRVGVEKSFFLSGMAFSVDLDAPNGPVVKIKTNSPVREPFLNFLVESQWPSGRILREYTLLMDLPTFSAQEASSVQAPKPVAQPQAQATPATPPPATVRTRPVAPQASASYASDSYGPVSANDNLWNIALKVRPSKEYSVQQTMIAIQRLNPDAFINDNINLLKRGQVLRIPDGDQIRELNFNQAVSEVAFQNDQWDTKSATKPTLVADNEAPSKPVQDAAGGRITLGVGSEDAADDTQSGAGSDSAGDTQSLQNDLGNTLEQLDTASRENTELRSRITELEAQIETMERLVEVSSAELRALQLASEQQTADSEAAVITEDESDSILVDETETIAEAAEATDDSDAAINEAVGSEIEDAIGDISDSVSSAAEEASAELGENIDAGVAAAESDAAELVATTNDEAITPTQATEPDQVQTSEATAAKPDARTVVTTGANKKPGLLDTIMDNIVLIAAVLIAVLVAAFALLRKVFGNKEEELEDTFNPFEEDPILEDEELDNQLGDEFEDHSATISEDLELDIDQPGSDEAIEEGENAVVPADIIAETDIYIAYGKFDQAEDMLEKAIAVEPENNAARLKLLEVHAGANNLEGFDKTLSELYQSEDQTAIDRGNELRTGFKDIAPFALVGAAGVAVSQAAQSLQDDDVTHKDLSQEFAELDSLDSVDSLDDEVIEDFDFDLDPEFDLGEEAADLLAEDTDEPVSSDAETKLNLAQEFSGLSETDPAEEITPDLSDSVSQIKSAADSSLDETDVTIQRKLSDLELEVIGDSNDSGAEPESLLTSGLDLVSDSVDVNDSSLDHSLVDLNPASNDDFEPSLDLDELSPESIDDIATQPNLDNVLNLNDVASDVTDDPVGLQEIDIDEDLVSTVDSMTTLADDALTNNEAESSGIDISKGENLNQNHGLEEVSDAAFDLDDGLDLTLEQPDFDEAGLDAIDGELQAAGNAYDNLESSADFISDSDLELDIADLDLDPESLSNDSEINSLLNQGSGDNELELNVGEDLEFDGDEIANIGAFQPAQSDMSDIDSGIEAETDLLQDADLDALDEEMDALAADVGLDQLTNSTVSVNEAEIKEDESYNSEEVFAEVLASTEQNLDDIDTDEGLNDDFDEGMDFLADTDESDTKLDLARAYIDMGDGEGARDILNEVLSDGNDEQKEEAQTLIEKIPS